MLHLYFVRHGLSIMNQQGIFSGRTETPLSQIGQRQAQQAGMLLKTNSVDCIISSPMQRAQQTAQFIAEQIGFPQANIIVNHLFTERDFGPLEGTTYTPNLGDAEGVEPIKHLIERAHESYRFLQGLPFTNIVVVSHGAIGRALRHTINPTIPFKPSKGFGNAEVVQLL